ncbi:hypothetical protein HDU82_002332 [Entophlyctis luteolus]|nr:hypothetical protein HDU82_002332 [Entophlyctis luteolus]
MLLKLNTTSDAVTTQWKWRFFVFTDQGNLYLFRSNKNLNASPVTYLPVNRCTTFDDAHDNSRILRVDGSGVDPSTATLVRRTWTLKTTDTAAFDMWHRTIVRHLAEKISSGSATGQQPPVIGASPGSSGLLRSNSNASSIGGTREGSANGRYVDGRDGSASGKFVSASGGVAGGATGGVHGGRLRQRSAENLSEVRRRAAAEMAMYRAVINPSAAANAGSGSNSSSNNNSNSGTARLQGLRQRSAENLADAMRRETAAANESARMAEWEGIASFGLSALSGQRGRQMNIRSPPTGENPHNPLVAESEDQRSGRSRVTNNEVQVAVSRSTSLARIARNPSPASVSNVARVPGDRARRLTLLEAELQDLEAEFESSM